MAPEMRHLEVALITGPRRQRFLPAASLQLHHVFVAFFLIYPACSAVLSFYCFQPNKTTMKHGWSTSRCPKNWRRPDDGARQRPNRAGELGRRSPARTQGLGKSLSSVPPSFVGLPCFKHRPSISPPLRRVSAQADDATYNPAQRHLQPCRCGMRPMDFISIHHCPRHIRHIILYPRDRRVVWLRAALMGHECRPDRIRGLLSYVLRDRLRVRRPKDMRRLSRHETRQRATPEESIDITRPRSVSQ